MKKCFLPIILMLLIIGSVSAQDVFLKKGQYILRDTGKPYSGIYKEFDAEKKLVSETSIRDGLLDGMTTLYFPSGAKKEVRAYLDGKKHGTWKSWNEAGQQTAEANFKDGKKDGAWFVWDDAGVKRYEMYYQYGEKKGIWIIRDETGKIISQEEFK